MKKITRHNYEAFFLDFLEGTLREELKIELKTFLAQNPDLAEELDEFENISLKPEVDAKSWESLKVPSLEDLKMSDSLREQLYFKCAEGEANSHDKKLLAELIGVERFRDEYSTWQKLKLTASTDSVDREGLYQLPIALPISSVNYEDFLVARTEGILSEEENEALENYASVIEGGEKDLALADSLKLEAPKGVFYPFKDELKKKKKGLILFYRAAAIILLLGLSASLFILLNKEGNSDPQYAQREVTQASPDTLKTKEKTEEGIEDSIPEEIEAEKYQLQEWEMREPDPVFVADNNEHKNMESSSEQEEEEISPQFENEDFDEIEFAEVEPVEVSEEDPQITIPEAREEDEMILAEEIPVRPTQKFKTITEFAEERVANQFNLSDEERDEMALSVAKRITQKAGETLDSELKKEVDEDGDRLTYFLRIGGFKVSHSTSK